MESLESIPKHKEKGIATKNRLWPADSLLPVATLRQHDWQRQQ